MEDLEALLDDGNRSELIRGALVVTPAPDPLHQRVEPDLVVVPDASVGDARLAGPVLLGAVSLDWPVPVSFVVAALARR